MFRGTLSYEICFCMCFYPIRLSFIIHMICKYQLIIIIQYMLEIITMDIFPFFSIHLSYFNICYFYDFVFDALLHLISMLLHILWYREQFLLCYFYNIFVYCAFVEYQYQDHCQNFHFQFHHLGFHGFHIQVHFPLLHQRLQLA